MSDYELESGVGLARAKFHLRQLPRIAFQPELLRELHHIAFGRIHPWAGEFRGLGQIGVVQGLVSAEPQRLISELKLLQIQSILFPAIVRSTYSIPELECTALKLAFCHLRFERIHPFRDGNGRIGRLMLSEQSRRELSLRSFTPAKALYFDALRVGNSGNLSPLASLILRQSVWEPAFSPFKIAPRFTEGDALPDLQNDLLWSRVDSAFWQND